MKKDERIRNNQTGETLTLLVSGAESGVAAENSIRDCSFHREAHRCQSLPEEIGDLVLKRFATIILVMSQRLTLIWAKITSFSLAERATQPLKGESMIAKNAESNKNLARIGVIVAGSAPPIEGFKEGLANSGGSKNGTSTSRFVLHKVRSIDFPRSPRK
jgi:hypothetical protein